MGSQCALIIAPISRHKAFWHCMFFYLIMREANRKGSMGQQLPTIEQTLDFIDIQFDKWYRRFAFYTKVAEGVLSGGEIWCILGPGRCVWTFVLFSLAEAGVPLDVYWRLCLKILETQPVVISSSAAHLSSYKWTILGSFAGFFFW